MSDPEALGGDLVSPGWVPPVPDTGVATPARMYAYYLGGKDHFRADREAAEQVLESMPQAREFARANRRFLTRAVRHLAEDGISQFLDIGIGLPAPGGTAQTALAVHPDARIVGVDNDPIVLAHARARPAGDDPAPAVVVAGDVRRPEAIVEHPEIRARLDFDRPVAVLLVAVLHFVEDADEPAEAVRTLMDAVAPGSALVISHVTGDFDFAPMDAAAKAYDKSTARVALRSLKEVTGFFDGLEVMEPGVVLVQRWRPDGPVPDDADRIWLYAGAARKP
ncbi:SAM-dependent methyltransferase [Catenulispora subtropica]|uniref:SAM-dependent methyltransferase n=1 Tax=Catenulispora subtropica TaxID=450798 RepID=A0ABN2SQN1_9ACTN